ncbi:MAG: Kae1-associated kinase Bud32, partial [Thermoprotei archaeon]
MRVLAKGIIEIPGTTLNLIITEGEGIKIRQENRNFIEMTIGKKSLEADINNDKYYGLVCDHIIPLEPSNSHSENLLRYYKEKVLMKWAIESSKLLVSEYGSLSRRIILSKEYFLLDHYRRKGSLFIILKNYFKILAERSLMNVDEDLLAGSLNALISEGYLKQVKYDDKFALGHKALSHKASYVRVFLGSMPYLGLLNLRVDVKALFHMISFLALNIRSDNILLVDLEEMTKRHMFLETDSGLIPFSTPLPMEQPYEHIRRLGGIINTTYLVKSNLDNELCVLKKYHEWTDLKWLPLALWALGAYNFDASAKRRLVNEYSMNRELKEKNFKVPKVYYISLKNKFIIEEHIEGRLFKDVIIESLKTGKGLEVIEDVLSEVAKVHNHNIVLGDANPTNMIVAEDNNVYFIDLEQAKYSDKYSWDLATLLFFTAHYIQGLSLENLSEVLQAMVNGYLRYGDVKVIKDALSPLYLRVFSVLA